MSSTCTGEAAPAPTPLPARPPRPLRSGPLCRFPGMEVSGRPSHTSVSAVLPSLSSPRPQPPPSDGLSGTECQCGERGAAAPPARPLRDSPALATRLLPLSPAPPALRPAGSPSRARPEPVPTAAWERAEFEAGAGGSGDPEAASSPGWVAAAREERRGAGADTRPEPPHAPPALTPARGAGRE